MAAVALSHTDIGTGPTALLFHGLFGRRRNWLQIQKSLSDRVRLIAVDLRNHGDSPWLPEMTYEAMADDLFELISRFGPPLPLIGHSMGGKAAMSLALQHPKQVKALMVIDIAPITYDHDYRPYIDVMRQVPMDELERRGDAEAYLIDGIPDPTIRAFLLQNLMQRDGAYAWQPNLDAIANGMDDILGFNASEDAIYDGPAVFLSGSNSDYVTAVGKQRIAELFPNARHFSIKDAGHWVHADQPQSTAAAIETFVSTFGEKLA